MGVPISSCRECAKKTGAFEQACQGTMYGPLRMDYGLPSRRKKERPNAEWSYIDVDSDLAPENWSGNTVRLG